MQAADNHGSTIQELHHSRETRSEIRGDGDEDPESAQGLVTETQGVESQVHKEEESGVDDQPADTGGQIQNAQTGSWQSDTRLNTPVGLHANPQRASSSSSEFVRESFTAASPEYPISPQTVLVGAEANDLVSSASSDSEYFQGPNEVVEMSCQECAARFQLVHPDFRIPDSVLRHLQLPAYPREEEIDIPVISLKFLMVDERSPSDKFLLSCQISEACKEWGVFQVRDHGIPNSVLESALDVAKRFFDLPMEDKLVYSVLYNDDESGYGGRRSPLYRLWGDHFVHVLHLEKSLEENNCPTNPPRYGESILRYAKLAMVLNLQLIDACAKVQDMDVTELEMELRDEYLRIMSRSCGTSFHDLFSSLSIAPASPTTSDSSEGNITDAVMQAVTATAVRVNYHPPCPQPELVLGIDPCYARAAFEIMLQNEVPGLQIFLNGHWRTIKCIPDALVVFVGKALEIVSKEMLSPYKAVKFRVMADKKSARISLTSAFGI